ncbi:MAG: hypothetical protein AUK54_08280 [Helicobacteraceae bacterium CG2_30_36_10]|nr:MAG: hypothetical protein AUK54_08280 [Helicobacteraceae bacterium CG2_30_36_10]
MSNMEYMFQQGFFGTRAPFFMDLVTLIVALLPLLVAVAIYFARKKSYKLHAFSQVFIYIFSVIVVSYFEFGVRFGGGFNLFMQGSSISHNYAFAVLMFHIAIAIITLIIWTVTIIMVKKQLATNTHKKVGMMTFAGVVMTSLTGIWVYALLFVY